MQGIYLPLRSSKSIPIAEQIDNDETREMKMSNFTVKLRILIKGLKNFEMKMSNFRLKLKSLINIQIHT